MSDHAGLSVNGSGTGEKIDTPLTQPGSQPVRYVLIDKEGRAIQWFYYAHAAAEYARHRFPGQEQDETRSGKGWDIEVVGATPDAQ